MRTLCEIFRSPRKEGMYLYVKREEGLSRVPQNLLSVFGRPEPAMLLMLEPGRRLALADVGAVITALDADGYYVQMPPGRRAEDPLQDALRASLKAPTRTYRSE